MPALAGTLSRRSYRYLSKNVRYLVDDPRFFWMKTMARFERVRALAAGAEVDHSPDIAPTSPTLAPAFSLLELVATLRDDGYVVGLNLRPALTRALSRRAEQTVCYAERDPKRPLLITERAAFDPALGPVGVASYFDQQEAWPEFQAVRADPWLHAIARAYLGAEPVYLRSELAWSFPRPAASHAERLASAQVFHCDINDFRTLKFFFYLTDVRLGDGPHAYLKKQPRARTLRHQLLGQRCASIAEAALLASYEDNEVVTVCGPAGTGFAGDPYYFHRGTAPSERPRLLLQIELGRRRYRTWYRY